MKNPKKYFEGFLSGASRISRVWGRHSPTRFPQGQNERKANLGTVVESCSEKLPLTSAADFAAIRRGRLGCFRQYSDCGGVSCPLLFPSTDRNGKCQTLRLIFSSLLRYASPLWANFPVTFFNNRSVRSAKNGRKKSSKSFQTYCLYAAVMGEWYSVVSGQSET